MIPAETIVDVKSRHELVSFIESAGVSLKRHGTDYLGLCPFHDDRRPSLSVSPSKQYWCCLGACSSPGKVVGGDVIEFARHLWNVSFREALVRLGGTTSVTLPPPAPRSSSSLRVISGRPRQLRPPVVSEPALLNQVVALYHQSFLSSAEAREYAVSRGLTSPELLAALPMGFSDGSLLERAPEGSETFVALQALGLITPNGRELPSRCLVVPLRDLAGNVVSLYGRKIEGDGHFYLPGPRRGLVNAACAATAEEIILAESVLDALSFLQAGIPNAIPLFGTNGYTADHDALLEKHRIRRVLLALDADEAGQKSAAALSEKLRSRGIDVRNVVLPVKDPNQLLVAEGPEGFRETWERLVSGSAEGSSEKRKSGGGSGGDGGERFSSFAAGTNDPPAEAPHEADAALKLDAAGAYELLFGSRTYRVRGLAAFGVDRMRVNLRVDQGVRFHVDTFDLYSARSRHAFVEASVKALRLDESDQAPIADEIAVLIAALEKERLSLRAQGKGEAVEPVMSASEREEALAFLRSPDLIELLSADFVSAGCVGEETAMLIAYFAMVSRKLEEPLSVLFCARSGAGKSTMQDRTCDFVPPEDLVKYTRISGQVLFYKEENALTHKLVAVDEEDGATQAVYALRSLLSSGILRSSVTRTDPKTGRQVAEDYTVKGPASVFLTSAHPEVMNYETRNRFVLLTADESKEQTRRILQHQRWAVTLEGLIASEKKKAILRRHHNAQRLLQPLAVVVPFDDAFPSGYLIARREHKKYLTLLMTIALLHQHQRPRKTLRGEGGQIVEYIEVAERDVEIARPLAPLILRRNLDELAPPTRSLLLDIQKLVEAKKSVGKTAAKKESQPEAHGSRLSLRRAEDDEAALVDRHEIQRATGLSLWHVKAYLAQLVEYEYLGLVTGRRGKRCLYELLWDGADEDPAIGLEAAPTVSETPHLAEPGGHLARQV
jgi:DNA primase catalytic core